MGYLLVHNKVKDFNTWKPVFDEHASMREAAGSKGGYVLQNLDDPSEVTIILEWDDMDKAREFAQSQDLREAMEKAGVIGPPDIRFLERVDRPSA